MATEQDIANTSLVEEENNLVISEKGRIEDRLASTCLTVSVSKPGFEAVDMVRGQQSVALNLVKVKKND